MKLSAGWAIRYKPHFLREKAIVMCGIKSRRPKMKPNAFFAIGLSWMASVLKSLPPNFFSFNNPYGACKRCEGYGKVIGIDEDLVIPDKSKSVYEGAIAPWRGEKMREWNDVLVKERPEI